MPNKSVEPTPPSFVIRLSLGSLFILYLSSIVFAKLGCSPQSFGFKIHLDLFWFYTYIVSMKELRFEWDNNKEKANIKKHGVSFDEARKVFFDENAIHFFDPDHSGDKDRFILLGISHRLRVLVVCHCFRKSDTVIRIFSARKADKDEKIEYLRNRK